MKDTIKEIVGDFWDFADDASENLVQGLAAFLAVIICGVTAILIIPVLSVYKTIIKAWRKMK